MEWISLKGLKKSELPKGDVLVTNNPSAIDNYGNMSHIWIANIDKVGKDYVGRFIPMGVMGVVNISNITHYCIPIFKH